MATVTVHNGSQTRALSFGAGETLHAILARQGVFHHAPCGGNGLCRRCKVKTWGDLTPPGRQEAELLTDAELLAGIRYCCMAVPAGDCHVQLDDEALLRQQPDFSLSVAAAPHTGYACGIDVGTTTLAAYLYDRAHGKRLAAASVQNRQSVFGDDVISRIHAVMTQNAAPLLRQSVAEQLNQLIDTLCRQANITPQEIAACAIAGNTTMLHLLTGLDPTGMAAAPFTPQSLFGTLYRGDQLGLSLACDVYLTPCVSAYVGGDVTAGLLACDFDTADETCLLVDVGTNGEMALVKDGVIHCLSTAAGPAFEGAHIRCGVGGVTGAVCHVDEQGFETIGHAPPVGLCGSGILDAVALLLRTGVLDETGYLAEDYPLTPDGKIYVTPKDMREIQLAKAAVCAGIWRLLELANVAPEAVDKVYFAGGFGSHMDPQSAAAIGLIPPALAAKCRAAGNTAGKGAVLAALSAPHWERLEQLAARCRYFELSGDARFNQLFTENMYFQTGAQTT